MPDAGDNRIGMGTADKGGWLDNSIRYPPLTQRRSQDFCLGGHPVHFPSSPEADQKCSVISMCEPVSVGGGGVVASIFPSQIPSVPRHFWTFPGHLDITRHLWTLTHSKNVHNNQSIGEINIYQQFWGAWPPWPPGYATALTTTRTYEYVASRFHSEAKFKSLAPTGSRLGSVGLSNLRFGCPRRSDTKLLALLLDAPRMEGLLSRRLGGGISSLPLVAS